MATCAISAAATNAIPVEKSERVSEGNLSDWRSVNVACSGTAARLSAGLLPTGDHIMAIMIFPRYCPRYCNAGCDACTAQPPGVADVPQIWSPRVEKYT